ncbi:MAG: MXAN_5187 C-terminal domain-containing protein [Blastocatellia bacterium]
MTIDEQLKRLEDDVRRLKIEYDVYFNGGSKRPPHDTRGRVESTIKRLAEERGLKYSQRFYYNTIVSRFVAMRENWRRIQQGREDGFSNGRVQLPGAVADTRNTDFSPVSVSLATGQEPDQVRRLYDSLGQAKQSCGEQNPMSYEDFGRMIASRTAQIRQKVNCNGVAFEIAIEEGQVKFKAKAIRI